MDSLYELNLDTGASSQLYTIELKGDYYSFAGMVAFKDTVYMIQKDLYDDEWANVRFSDGDLYKYEGEKLLCYNKSSKKAEYMDLPNIKLIAKKSDTELLVYAYDGEGGFYFTFFDIVSKRIGEKYYTNMKIQDIISISYDSILDKILCKDYKGIFAVNISNIGEQAYFYEKGKPLFINNELQILDGYTYCALDFDGKKRLARLNNAALIKDNPVLKSYVIGGKTLYSPAGYGYTIDSTELNYDELAIRLLAGDSDYDFLVLSTYDQMASWMRDLGAYEPLNDVDGLESFLDKCFDYIKDAAILDNKDIWMLPIGIECPIIIYNQKLLDEYGLKIEDINSCEEFVNIMADLPQDGSVFYDLPYYYMTEYIINLYLHYYCIKDNKANFDTEIFRRYAQLMKRYDINVMNDEKLFNYRIESNTQHDKLLNDKSYKDSIYAKLMVKMERGMTDSKFKEYSEYDFFRAAAVPGLEEGSKTKILADCIMIVVNPKSKKTVWLKDYLSRLCKSLKEDQNSCMLKDLKFSDNILRQDIQDIYAEAEIFFQYPYELTDPLTDYRLNDKPLDEVIKEIERRFEIYLNE